MEQPLGELPRVLQTEQRVEEPLAVQLTQRREEPPPAVPPTRLVEVPRRIPQPADQRELELSPQVVGQLMEQPAVPQLVERLMVRQLVEQQREVGQLRMELLLAALQPVAQR